LLLSVYMVDRSRHHKHVPSESLAISAALPSQHFHDFGLTEVVHPSYIKALYITNLARSPLQELRVKGVGTGILTCIASMISCASNKPSSTLKRRALMICSSALTVSMASVFCNHKGAACYLQHTLSSRTKKAVTTARVTLH
jgi:hypothetical protein